jgi:hypothetical protein
MEPKWIKEGITKNKIKRQTRVRIQTKVKIHCQNANEMNLYGAQIGMDKRGNNQK